MRITCKYCGGKGSLPCPQELRAKRERAKKTLTEVAARMGISKARLSSLETGRWDWNATLVDKFQSALKDLG